MNKEEIKRRIKDNSVILGALFFDVVTAVISILAFGLEEIITPAVVMFMMVMILKNYIILFVDTVFKNKTRKKDLRIALLEQENKHLQEIEKLDSEFRVKYKLISEDELLTNDIRELEKIGKLKRD